MKTGEICTREVVVCRRPDSLTAAAQLMREHHVGDVIVVEDRQGGVTPVGVLTDRDIVIGPVAQSPADIARLLVEDVMTSDITTVREDESVIGAVEKMAAQGIRRIPVVDGDDRLVGVLAFDDVVDLMAGQLTLLARVVARGNRRETERRPGRSRGR
jgi:CBS domain-containing protein